MSVIPQDPIKASARRLRGVLLAVGLGVVNVYLGAAVVRRVAGFARGVVLLVKTLLGA